MLNSQETRIYKRPMIGWKSREITFQQYRENLPKQEFSDGLQISMNMRYYYTFDNSLLFTESIQNTTQIFPR